MTAPSVCFLHNTPLSARHRGIQKTWRRCTSSSTRQAKTAVWFATEDLEPGALIVNVHDLMAMTKPHHRNATEAQVHAAITHLPPADHVRLLDLHDGHRSLPSRLPRIETSQAPSASQRPPLSLLEGSVVYHPCEPKPEHDDDVEDGGRSVLMATPPHQDRRRDLPLLRALILTLRRCPISSARNSCPLATAFTVRMTPARWEVPSAH